MKKNLPFSSIIFSRSIIAASKKIVQTASLLFVLLCSFNKANAATFTVTNLNDAGAGSLRQAILDANANPGADVIIFDAGVTGIINLSTGQLVISDALTITGPGANLLSVRSAVVNNRVMYIANIIATISGLTIKDGTLYPAVDDGNQENYDGSGILNYGDLTLESCVVSDNIGISHWAVVEVGAQGTGINNHGTLQVNNSVIHNNHGNSNETFTDGGGIFNTGTAYVTNSTISNNSATRGGGISNGSQGQLTVANSTVSNNEALLGGGIALLGGNVTVTHSTISGNSTNFGAGAGIYSEGELAVTNSTVSGNTGVLGGGMFAIFGVVNLTNATVTNNSVTTYGGGILNGVDDDRATINSRNSIIAGNSATVAGTHDYGFETIGVNPQDYGLITSLGYNLFGKVDAPFNGGMNGPEDQLGSTVSPIIPLLGPLANNGGPTMTHALLTGSPAIDKGSFVTGITTDQRGSVRPVDIPYIPNAASGNGSDIGAFEKDVFDPGLTINDVTQNELNSGTSSFTFTVSLSAPAGAGGVTFDIATADGTAQDDNPAATEDNDYVQKTLTSQTIPAGSSTYSFVVTVNGDNTFEPDESFFVNVTNVTGASVSDGQGLGTITNDDACINNPIVVNSNDAGPGSLRQAIADACPNSIITFNMGAGIVTSPINLTSGQLVIDKNLTIQGPGANLLSVQNTAADSRVFYVENVAATISSLTISGGNLNPPDFQTLNSGDTYRVRGGGIFNTGQLNVTNCTISDNHTFSFFSIPLSGGGNGIYNTGTLWVTNSLITNNTGSSAGLADGNGGGIFNVGTAYVDNSTISNNGEESGGGITNQGGLTVTNSTISGNTTRLVGGGIHSYSGTSTVTNSTISGNNAINGGGLYKECYSTVYLYNVTISNNSAATSNGTPTQGGGIYAYKSNSCNQGATYASNTIIAGNSPDDYWFPTSGIAPASYAQIISLGHNIVGKIDPPHSLGFNGPADQVGSSASPINPLLGPLANNGGPTMTHALLPGSTAIDKGSAVASMTTDQRGETRPVDNSSIPNATNGNGSDIGAFEVQCSSPAFSACPSNQSVNALTNSCSNVVTYTATATGTPDPTITYAFTGATTGSGNGTGSGSSFNVGVTTATLTASNNCGEPASCTFTVTVVDAQNPSITCPANITQNNDANQCGALVTYAATASDNCPGVSVSYSPASGSFFPVGTTTVTATATDAVGRTASCTFTVTVVDAQNPSITCPANITQNNDPNQCGAVVTYAATASDNCPGVSVSYSPASGSFFPVGTTTVTATATDAVGRTASCTFTVTVVDAQNPSITCPANITQNNDPNQCGAVVTYAATASDNCPGVSVSYSPASGSFFPVGTTTVTATATDAVGRTASCTFTVTVVDAQNPSITCPANITQNNDNNQCGAVVNYAATASDNCPGVSVSYSPLSGSFFPVGTTTVTATATDAVGRTASCTFTVTVVDAQNPTITCPANITVNNDANQCGAVVTYSATASDNCPGVSISYSPASGSFFPVGTTTVTATATDAVGRTASCSFTVTVNDEQPPTLTCPGPVTVSCASAVPAPNIASVTGVSDNCGGTVTVTHVDDVISNQTCLNRYTITRTYKATDAAGNSASCTQLITVNDVTPPVFTVIGPYTVSCASQVPAAGPAEITSFSDNCDVQLSGTASDVISNQTCANRYTITRTYTVYDACGNTATASIIITVNDQTAPVAPTLQPIIAECSVTPPSPIAQDNCGPVTGTTTTQFPITTQGVTAITWTFNDGCGNISTTIQYVFLNDQTPPVPPTNLPTVVDECGVTLTAPTGTDACTGTITATTFTPFPVTAQGTTVVTWIFNDGNGNISFATQTVIVNDVTAPVAPNLPTITAECSITVTPPTTTDNCAGTVTGFTGDPLTYTAQGSYTITWIFSDGNGNITLAKQTVVIDDVTPPVPPVLPDITAECTATPATPVAQDNCAGPVTGTTTTVFPITAQGTTVVTWTFDDGNGNISTATQNVILHDVTPPTITCPASITQAAGSGSRISTEEAGINAHGGGGNYCSKFINVPNAVFNDNCGIPTSLTWTMTGATTGCSESPGINQVGGKTFNAGVTTITYIVTDAAGNTATCSFTVTVTESVLPNISCPGNRKVNADYNSCYASNVNLGNPSVYDNCGIASVTNNAPSQYPVGVTVVTWTVTDKSGNTRTCTQTVTVVDNQDPIVNCPSNITQNAGSNCETSVTTPNPVFSDNCEVTKLTWCMSGATTGDSPSWGINFVGTTTFNIGVTTITYTVRDASGRTSSCCFSVTVEDNQAPVITCPANILYTISNNNCSKRINVPNPTFSDNCSCVSLSWCMTGATTGDSPSWGINYVGSKTFNAGVTTITYTAEDVYGNTAQCSFTVTVRETVLPTITCPSNRTVNTNYGYCYATNVNLGNPKVGDNCGVASVTNNAPTQYPVGTTSVEWTVTDKSGNTRSCTQTVTVVDNQKPAVNCPADITICKVATNMYTIAPMTRTDNCGIASTTYQVTGVTSRSGTGTDASGLFNEGLSSIRWTVTDVHGNVSHCTTKVTVVTSGNCTNVRLITAAPKPPEVKEPKNNSKLDVIVKATRLEVIAYPNPTEYYFNLRVKSPNKETVEIRMYDMTGKLVQQNRGAPEKTYRFGDQVVSGMYIIEVRQAGQTATIKVVKQ